MKYQNSKEQFAQDVKRALHEKGFTDIEVYVKQVDNINRSYESLAVRRAGSNLGMSFMLEDYLTAAQRGASYQKIVNMAVNDIKKNIRDLTFFDLDTIRNYEDVKNRLSLELISAERNAEVLEYLPHKRIEDMAVVYRINVEHGEDKISLLMNKPMLHSYGISLEQLHKDAKESAAVMKPAIIRGVGSVLCEAMGIKNAEEQGSVDMDEDEMLFIASVPSRDMGAAVLAYDSFLEDAAKKLGGDFFVLPSSVKEALLLKDDGETPYHVLKSIVLQVNATEVPSDEKLTDNVYHYDSKNKLFELGEKYEKRRRQEKISEKGSVLKDLQEKQASTAEQTAGLAHGEKKVSRNLGGEER